MYIDNFQGIGWFMVILIIIGFVDFYLKAKAMWKAAKNNDKGWFMAIFVFNTAGILPLIYLYKKKLKKLRK